MQPEISKRCPACGAAIRTLSYFCPHCGRPLKDDAPNPSGPAAEQETSTTKTEREKTEREIGGSAMMTAASLTGEPASEAPSGVEDAGPDVHDEDDERIASGGSDGARVKFQRARAAARDAMGEKVGPRVEKLRQASTIVFDEAADDPSLRFVLIAVALFLLFIILLLLSRFLG